jgi:hypothetical protein
MYVRALGHPDCPGAWRRGHGMRKPSHTKRANVEAFLPEAASTINHANAGGARLHDPPGSRALVWVVRSKRTSSEASLLGQASWIGRCCVPETDAP